MKTPRKKPPRPFLKRLPKKHWIALNTRRGNLIKAQRGNRTLSADDQAEFDALQFLADCQIRREAPFDFARLRRLEARVRKKTSTKHTEPSDSESIHDGLKGLGYTQ